VASVVVDLIHSKLSNSKSIYNSLASRQPSREAMVVQVIEFLNMDGCI
jgi:hypothetical protein